MLSIRRCALGTLALYSVACLGCAQTVADPMAEETVPETYPLIEIDGHRMERLRVNPAPPPFHTALTFVNEQPKSVEAGNLKFTAKRGGVIVLQASFADDGAGDWKRHARTRETMPQNWIDLGTAPWDETQILFMREFKAGQPCAIRTRKYIAPQPILIDEAALDSLREDAQRELTAREAILLGLRGPTALAPVPVVAERPVSPPAGAAVLDVQGMNLYALEGDNIPPYLQGAAMYRRDESQDDGVGTGHGMLRFRVVEGGQVFLLASWKEPTGGSAMPDTLSYRQLTAEWAPLCRCPWDPDFWLFVRDCEAGEQFKLRTRKYSPPLPILAPPVDLLSEEYADLVSVRLYEYRVQRQIRRLVDEENYAEIERLASAFRQPGATFPSIHSPLAMLYGELVEVKEKGNQHYLARIAQFEEWVAANGNSLTARVALAGTLRAYAYFIRGRGFANEVTERQFEAFHEQLARAEQVLLDLDEDVPRDVAYYAELIGIGTGLGASRDDVLSWTLAAAELDPWNAPATFSAAIYFLPRWHGEPGDLVKLAEAMSEATHDQCGEALYARVVMGVRDVSARRTFVEDDFSWERTWQGLVDLRKRFPQSRYLLNVQCQLACLAFDSELAQTCFAEIGDDPDLKVWDTLETYEMRRKVFSPGISTGDQERVWLVHADGAKYACFSPDGTKLLTSGHDSLIKVWDAATGQEVRRQALMGEYNCIEFLNDQTVVIGGHHGDLYFWNWEDDEIQRVTRMPARIRSLNCSPDGRYLFLADGLGNSIVVDLKKQQRIYQEQEVHGRFTTGAFSPDSRFLATTGSDGRIILHNLEVGQPESTFGKGRFCRSAIAFSPDGTRIAAGNLAGHVQVWEINGWKEAAITYEDGGTVRGLSFTSDGKQLVIARAGGTHFVKGGLWICTVADRVKERRIAGHTMGVPDVDFAPDGKTFVSVGADWTLRLYDSAKLQSQ